MSKVIAIMGESGSGKTTSMRNLDPTTTYYIDADRKGLSWKGWRNQYNAENKNYYNSTDINVIKTILSGVSEKRPEIKHIIIDTVNGIMIADEMKRAQEKGYDKWIDLAQCVWELMDGFYDYRDDLWIIPVFHTQTERDDNGYMFTHIKTSGRKLEKIVPESKLTTVLYTKCNNGKYVFETQSQNSTAKSPMGAFETLEIDNDITKAIEALEEF